jgi:hypothetical protein
MGWCLVKHRDNFTFILTFTIEKSKQEKEREICLIKLFVIGSFYYISGDLIAMCELMLNL